MVLAIIILSVLFLSALAYGLNKKGQVRLMDEHHVDLHEEILDLQMTINGLHGKMMKNNDLVTNLTEAEKKRVEGRIAKKRDQGLKVK